MGRNQNKYYMFNKPRGCVTARRDARHKTVMDYFPQELRDVIFPIGRLDRDTEGLLLLTDDGMLVNRLMQPDRHVSKTYYFWAQGIPDEERLAALSDGVRIYTNSDHVTSPAKVQIIGRSTLRGIKEFLSETDGSLSNRRGDVPATEGLITITEGKKHQVKRMVRYTGAKVLYLKRLSIGGLALDPSLAVGTYRPLTEAELELLIT